MHWQQLLSRLSTDRYRQNLHAVIQAKIRGQEIANEIVRPL